MKFDVPEVRECLMKNKEVYTVRSFESRDRFTVVPVNNLPDCLKEKLFKIKSYKDLTRYTHLSGFKSPLEWWRKIEEMKVTEGWLYRVSVLEEEEFDSSAPDTIPRIRSFNGEYRFLSNFHLSPMIDRDGREYASVEHYYQSHKTSDMVVQEEIRLASTPGLSKRLGRQCKCNSDWESAKDEVMEYALRLKYTGELKGALLATAPSILEEGNSWGDTYWGICKGDGLNNLGKMLMKIRDDLAEEDFFSAPSIITFTGNRNIKASEVQAALQAVHEKYPNSTWRTGMAYGLELAVAEFAAANDIPFEAHLPFPAYIQTKRWNKTNQEKHLALLEKAVKVFTHSQEFSMAAYQTRNVKMAEGADVVIAFEDKDQWGTIDMVSYCIDSGIPVIDGYFLSFLEAGVAT